MVQFMNSDTTSSSASRANKVKLETREVPDEEEHGPLLKRSKKEQWGAGANAFPDPEPPYNPLDEPSPLGLRLRKSPSLLDLIQMTLSQNESKLNSAAATAAFSVNEDKKAVAASGGDKPKASSFPALVLRIGSWEYKSRYEGDLVAKCYFAKHKLVWEVLESGLKSKIEIQWSDIMALKANCQDNEPGTLNIVLARQPLFYRETNPQPRKHTLWQSTADFTNGQASIHKQHFLQCSQGLLNKNFEKLIQCDTRLNFLSQQPEIILDSPYFEMRPSVFEDVDESKDETESGKGPSSTTFQDLVSPSAAQSSSLEFERGDTGGTTSEHISREAPSPSSGTDVQAIEGSGNCEAVDSKGPRNWDQIKVPGLRPSMSMSDLMSHIGNCISERMTFGNQSSAGVESDCQEILEDIAEYLLSDTQQIASSDEKRLMTRVNSLCCLLQQDPASTQNLQAGGESCMVESAPSFDEKRLMARVNSLCCLLQQDPASTQSLPVKGGNCNADSEEGKKIQLNTTNESLDESKTSSDVTGNMKELSGSKQAPGMSRKDSFGDLLLHLPRIASLPKFLFNISEDDGESQGR